MSRERILNVSYHIPDTVPPPAANIVRQVLEAPVLFVDSASTDSTRSAVGTHTNRGASSE